MKSIISLVLLVSLGDCGIISHDDHGKATSYQNIHMEHFHPVPTYIKKEHQQFLDHPVSIGQSSSKVEINHGGKHEIGYGYASVSNNVHAHGHGDDLQINVGGEDYQAFQGHGDVGTDQSEALGGHEAEATDYSVQDQGHDYSHYISQLVQSAQAPRALGLDHHQYQVTANDDEDEHEHQASNKYHTYTTGDEHPVHEEAEE